MDTRNRQLVSWHRALPASDACIGALGEALCAKTGPKALTMEQQPGQALYSIAHVYCHRITGSSGLVKPQGTTQV